jgi:hypothetical protein
MILVGVIITGVKRNMTVCYIATQQQQLANGRGI